MNVELFAPMGLSSHSLVGPPHPDPPRRHLDKSATKSSCVGEMVACLDGSELGSGIVPHARLIARALGARLTLLHVLDSEAGVAGDVPADPLDWGIRQLEARALLDIATTRLGNRDTVVCSEVIQGNPAEQICNWAKRHDVDLTALCSHGTRGLTEWDLGGTARKLIDRVPGSLLLVPAAAAAKGNSVQYQRILLPLDGSPRAESVVPTAIRIAAAQDAEILLVHVVPDPEIIQMGSPDAEGAELKRTVMERNERVASAYLDRLRARIKQSGTRVRTLVVGDGRVRTKLEQLIREEKADLVVMSAHGASGRIDSPCGGVTEYILTHANIPLLVVRDRDGRRARQVGQPSARPSERSPSSGLGRL